MNQTSTYHQTDEQISSEYEIIEKAKKDPEEFRLLYDKYFLQIFRFVARRVETSDEAGDITCDVFATALAHLKSYTSKGIPFGAWLYQIARNAVQKYYRENKNRHFVEISADKYGEIFEQQPSADEDDEQRYTSIENALSKLSEDEVEFVQLRFFEDHSFKEIGQILNIPENTARVKTFRVVGKLKKLISR